MEKVLDNLKDLNIEVYLDSADLEIIKRYSSHKNVKGFTSSK